MAASSHGAGRAGNPSAGTVRLRPVPLPGRQDLDAIFLDAGNTLVGMDSTLVSRILASEGVDASPASFERAEAASRPALSAWLDGGVTSESRSTFLFYVHTILERLGVTGDLDALAHRLVVAVKTTVPTQRLWSRVLPGVPEALAALRADGLRLVVVSNSDGTVEQGLTDAGLRPLLDDVVDSAIVGVEKPAPGIFEAALRVVGAPPSRVLHVGDLWAADVVGARGVGLHAVLLDPYGDWPDDVDCPRVADLTALARALVGAPS
jgi:putative hydrolase of the HAD superfamily